MATGAIRVQTENIFPIIKKFLYSDHEIFIRELVSNAVDATRKLKTISSVGEFKGELGEPKIEVRLNAKNKTISIVDQGIGMTAEEVDKYLNQVAFSSAEEFLAGFNEALTYGIARKRESLDHFRDRLPACGDCLAYLEQNISYDLDEKKRAGLERFLGYLSSR